VVNLVQRGTASVTRIHELLSEQPIIEDTRAVAARAASGTRLRGEIEFRNLSFSYPVSTSASSRDDGDAPAGDGHGRVPVLHNISLKVPAGSSLAIVGPTGSGKSTLVNLLPRIYDAPEGTVLIDGQSVRDYPLHVLRSNIGFVPQETFLFSETIRENIVFGAPDAAPDGVYRAAEAAHIRSEFDEFPAGFETMVGERGLTLSGGQKQRTAIARAIVRDPAILILDDALASVDTYTEEKILDHLREIMLGRTTIFISHRISTIRHADQIAVLVKGRIAELGTHEELLNRRSFYASLYQKQQLEEELTGAR
jgi:ATP-binding cassette subfamily B protein